jgi:hypothetical protein
MAKSIKVGGLVVEVPDDSPLLSPERASACKTAERPAIPDEPEQQAYVYQPNDPYGAAVGRVHAIGNLPRVDKPWVRKTFFLFLVVLPFTCIELAAVASTFSEDGVVMKLKMFLLFSGLAVLFSAPYFVIWKKSRKAKGKANNGSA